MNDSKAIGTRATALPPDPKTSGSADLKDGPLGPSGGMEAVAPRFDWIQTAQTVEITIYAKNIQTVETKHVDSKCLNVCLQPGNWVYAFELQHPISKVVHEHSAFKVILTLHKKFAHTFWTFVRELPVENSHGSLNQLTKSTPNGSKWDALEDPDAQPPDPKDFDGFLRHLYSNADPDAQKAMKKSMSLSNGTTLSMDWKDIGKPTWSPGAGGSAPVPSDGATAPSLKPAAPFVLNVDETPSNPEGDPVDQINAKTAK